MTKALPGDDCLDHLGVGVPEHSLSDDLGHVSSVALMASPCYAFGTCTFRWRGALRRKQVRATRDRGSQVPGISPALDGGATILVAVPMIDVEGIGPK